MAYTAAQIINMTLRSLGVLAEGETPSDDTSADALMAMNMMIDSWSTERLLVYTTETQTFTWPSGSSSETLGPTGSFVGNRPVTLDDATYFTVGDLSYQIALVNEEQYNSIVLKSSTSPYPEVLYVNMEYPDVTMKIYPVPNGDIEMHIVNVKELAQPADISTTLAFPPGYMRAFWSNLAREIAAQFGIACPKNILDIATTSKRNIERINNPMDVMSMPSSVLPMPSGFNWYTGQPY